MFVYKISCRSKCGTYFMPYLQSVTVIAGSQEQAIDMTQQWLIAAENKFLQPQSEWYVELLCEVGLGVIDWVEDSDY